MVLNFIAIAVTPALLLCDVTAERISDLLDRVQETECFRQQAELLDELKLNERERTSLASSALESREEHVRLFGVVVLQMTKEKETFEKLSRVAISDESVEVSRLGWLGRLGRHLVTEEERKELLKSDDVQLRAGLALSATTASQLEPLTFDKAALIRALVGRRLGAVCRMRRLQENQSQEADADQINVQKMFDVLLSDKDALVCGNAIVGAWQARYVPLGTMRGLVTDDRDFWDVWELIGDEPEIEDLRSRYDMKESPSWTNVALGIQMATQLEMRPISGRVLVPIGERSRIGTVAADCLLGADEVKAALYLKWVISHLAESKLKMQLEIVLMSTVKEP